MPGFEVEQPLTPGQVPLEVGVATVAVTGAAIEYTLEVEVVQLH